MRPESAGSRRRRRVALFLAILLLTAVPLYLWPLHGAIPGLPGAAALSGVPPDPRSAKALAQLPAEVWDGLMGYGGPPAPSTGGAKARGNLTRIAPHEEGDADAGSGGAFTPHLDPGVPLTTLLVDSGAGSSGDSSGGSSSDSTSSPGAASGTPPSGGGAGGQRGGGEWSPFAGGVGPFSGGGGAGVPPPSLVADPAPSDPPMPTPEPATLLLVGFNMAVVGAMAWRRLNRGRERKPSG
jgi:hypothetical protein